MKRKKKNRNIFYTKYKNTGVYIGLNKPHVIITSKNVKSFILEANNLSNFQYKHYNLDHVKLFLQNKKYDIFMIDRRNRPQNFAKNNILKVRKFHEFEPFVTEKAKFTCLELLDGVEDKKTTQALKKLLKSEIKINEANVPQMLVNVWEILNEGGFLEIITLRNYDFRMHKQIPQFYKLKQLKVFKLIDSSFYADKKNKPNKIFFRNLKFCDLDIFEYSYYRATELPLLSQTKGELNQNAFKGNENFLEYFDLNFTSSSCSFDINDPGHLSEILCRLYLTKIVKYLENVDVVNLARQVFQENEFLN